MATPTPMFRQRDAVTQQPNVVDGRGPKGVFHLTPQALSNVSAEAAKPGKEWSTMVPMARMRERCQPLAMSATWRPTGARGRRIVDEKGVTGQADGVNYVELTGMRGRRNNVGHSVGVAAAAMKMIGVRMTKGPIACMRILSTLRRVRTTVDLQLARDSGVAPW
jgi:hypothetical protein